MFGTENVVPLLISAMRIMCLAHVVLLDLITLIVFGEDYKLWSSSLCNFLHLPFIVSLSLSLLGSHISLSTLFSHTLNLCSSLSVRHASYITY